MKRKIVVIIISNLAAIFSQILFARCQEQKNIENCIEFTYAPSIYYHRLYDQLLCIDCGLGYVVSKNYKSCIQFIDQLSFNQYGNCKRLGQDGLCVEALNGIELLPNNQYTIVRDQKFFERCAIINESETECLFPRFGFILDKIKKLISKDTSKTFCALFDSENQRCSQFHQRFISYQSTQQGVYLGENFVNPDKIISFFQLKKCADGFSFCKNEQDQLVGCFPMSNSCYDNKKICQKGEALRDDQQMCQYIIPFCIEYFEIQGKRICAKCQLFYRLYLQNCIKMSGCILLSRKDPNKCLQCDSQSLLQNGQCNQKNNLNSITQNQDHKNSRQLNFKQNIVSYSSDLLKDNLFQLKIDNQMNINQQNSFYENKLFNQNQNTQIKYRESKLINLDNAQNRSLEEQQQQIEQDQIDQCKYDSEGLCVQCQDLIKYYLDSQKNLCINRLRSLFCLNQSQRADECLNLKCQNNRFINPYLIQNFDLKNEQVLKYIAYFQNLFFESDHFMTEYEKEQMNQYYLFYRVNLNFNGQICLDYSNKLKNNEKLIYFKSYEDADLIKRKIINVQNKSELDYLYYTYRNKIISKNITIDNCIVYNTEQSFCLECKYDFYFNSKTMICEKSIENCIVHSLDNTCILCQSGYQLNSQIRCDPVCSSFIPGSVFYFHSLYVQKSDSDINQTICKQTQVACKMFVNNICTECFQGYILDHSLDHTCVKDYYFPDCQIIDKINQEDDINNVLKKYIYEEKQCIQCIDEYVLYEGLCYCQKQRCLSYIYCDEKKCIKKFRSSFLGQLNLSGNQYLEKYGDYFNVKDCLIKDCYLCYQGNICLNCRSGFQLEDSQRNCIIKKEELQEKYNDKNCLIFSKDGLNCIQCKPQYYLRKDLKCYEQCQIDQQVFVDNLKRKYCYDCPLGCVTCVFSYEKFIGQKKQPCNQCVDNYFFYTELKLCKKKCIFYQNNNICSNLCDGNNIFILGKQCVEKCPQYYEVKGEHKFCKENCEGLYRYDDDSQKCSVFCEINYFIDQQNKICRGCKIDNCFTCSSKLENFCIRCFSGYQIYKGYCIFICPNNLFVKNQKDCPDSTIQYCLEEQDSKCVKCITNTINEKYQCVCSFEYIFDFEINMCVKKCDENCQICSLNKEQCLKCKQNKYLDKSVYKCIDKCRIGQYSFVNTNDPSIKQCRDCSQNCFSCDNSNSCTKCNEGYEEFICNGMLFCICNQKYCFKEYNLDYVKKQCCNVQNCLQCENSIQICQKCKQDYPYLYLNTCLQFCPDGTYSDDNKQCQKCHPLCKDCTSSSSRCCLSCVLSQHIVESEHSCRCSNKKVFFESQCYSACPRFTKLLDENDRVCQQYCLDNYSYPVFDDNGLFEKCEYDFSQSNSKFCEQNLVNLNKFITFEIQTPQKQDQKNQSVLIIITINQTPRECYDFKLSFNSSFQNENDDFFIFFIKDFNIESYLKFQLRIQSQIDVEKLRQKDQNKCQYNICTLYLQIYQEGMIKQTIKLKINLKSQVIDDQSLNFPFLNQITKFDPNQQEKGIYLNIPVIVNYISQVISNDDEISAQVYQPVQIRIQVLFDDKELIKKKLVLFPVNIHLVEEDNKIQQISNFFYKNDLNSQIILEFVFEKEVKGKLNLTLKAIDSKKKELNYEQFVNKDEEIYYIQKSLIINIIKEQDLFIDQTSQKSFYIIMFIFNIIVYAIMIIIVLNIFVQKRLQNKNQHQQSEVQQASS